MPQRFNNEILTLERFMGMLSDIKVHEGEKKGSQVGRMDGLCVHVNEKPLGPSPDALSWGLNALNERRFMSLLMMSSIFNDFTLMLIRTRTLHNILLLFLHLFFCGLLIGPLLPSDNHLFIGIYIFN
ncbi:hypothetical protein ACFE04_012348 [Oxalis oulophora]